MVGEKIAGAWWIKIFRLGEKNSGCRVGAKILGWIEIIFAGWVKILWSG